MRAITKTALIAVEPPDTYHALSVHDYWTFLMGQCFKQFARVNLHQLMIGRLETEARVASFLLALALRNVRDQTLDDKAPVTVALPMSRVDIANYLVINCDTLSSTMMRLGEQGLIERLSRHAIRVTDVDALMRASPIASLLSKVYSSVDDDSHSNYGLTAEPASLFNIADERPRAPLANADNHPNMTFLRETPYRPPTGRSNRRGLLTGCSVPRGKMAKMASAAIAEEEAQARPRTRADAHAAEPSRPSCRQDRLHVGKGGKGGRLF